MDGVQLEFTQEALVAAAKRALELKTGARGLRQVMEEAMLDAMYELPGQDNVEQVVVNDETITNGAYPLVGLKSKAVPA
jgi:ATP-dependent Clp protease ATP-binding subunit ClpX